MTSYYLVNKSLAYIIDLQNYKEDGMMSLVLYVKQILNYFAYVHVHGSKIKARKQAYFWWLFFKSRVASISLVIIFILI